jgi:hypothetical protein
MVLWDELVIATIIVLWDELICDKLITLFGWAYQHGLSAVVQCFSLTTKQPQPAYKPQKQPAEQGEWFYPLLGSSFSHLYYVLITLYMLACNAQATASHPKATASPGQSTSRQAKRRSARLGGSRPASQPTERAAAPAHVLWGPEGKMVKS